MLSSAICYLLKTRPRVQAPLNLSDNLNQFRHQLGCFQSPTHGTTISKTPIISHLSVRLLINIRVAAERELHQETSRLQASYGQNSRGRELESVILSEIYFTEPRTEADADDGDDYCV